MPKPNILLVDDELMLLLGMQRMLEDLYDISLANGGQEAIEILNKSDKIFDLIICDISMPDINGANLYLYIINKYPEMANKIIFMTGGRYSNYLDEFFTDSKKICLLKPFEYEALRKAIKNVLDANTTS